MVSDIQKSFGCIPRKEMPLSHEKCQTPHNFKQVIVYPQFYILLSHRANQQIQLYKKILLKGLKNILFLNNI